LAPTVTTLGSSAQERNVLSQPRRLRNILLIQLEKGHGTLVLRLHFHQSCVKVYCMCMASSFTNQKPWVCMHQTQTSQSTNDRAFAESRGRCSSSPPE
jgi:hypothetical protein